MAVCPHCYSHFETRAIFAGQEEQGMADGTRRLNEMMSGYNAVHTGVMEGVSKQDLFEAAIGTLGIVAKEVTELQAAKIHGAIKVLIASRSTN